MKFGIRLQGAYAEVREGGVYRTDTPFKPGDVFRIRIGIGGIVKYFKNGTLFYKSTQAPVDPSVSMLVDTSLQSIGATITNVIIYTAPRP